MGMGYNTVNLLMIMTIYSVNGYPLTNSKNFNATLVGKTILFEDIVRHPLH